MTKETLSKAKELEEDLKILEKVIFASEDCKWIKIITPREVEHYHSVRFQKELAEWVKNKKQEYEEELERL